MWEKRYLGLFAATVGVFMAIYFRVTLTYVQKDISMRVDCLQQDHIAIEDYTVVGKISHCMYTDILHKHNEKYDESQDMPPIHTLSQYLREGILGGLEDLPEEKQNQGKNLLIWYEACEECGKCEERCPYDLKTIERKNELISFFSPLLK